MMLRNVLVPLDGAPQAAEALPLARTLATANQGVVCLLRVVPEVGTATATRPQLHSQAQAYLESISHGLMGDALQVTPCVRSGDPATQIVEQRAQSARR